MPLATAVELSVCDAVASRIQTIQGSSGLTFTATRVYSFGFTDAELTSLQVPIRPHDTEYDASDRSDERCDYSIEVGVIKMVTRKDVAGIDKYFNLAIAIGKLFPLDYRLTVGSGYVLCVGKRHSPMIEKSVIRKIMDSTESTTRFESNLFLTFRDWVDE